MTGYWSHWIGRGTYTMRSFIAEAKKYGVSRRIAPKLLKSMNWGDWVYLVIKQNASDKSGLVFGFFVIEHISGVNQEVTKALAEDGKIIATTGLGGLLVSRKCGSYTTGPSFTVDASISEISEKIEEVGGENWLMISGPFYEIDPKVRLIGLDFFRGFSAFDGEEFRVQLSKTPSKNGIVRLQGCFYAEKRRETDDRGKDSGEVRTVLEYQKGNG